MTAHGRAVSLAINSELALSGLSTAASEVAKIANFPKNEHWR
jgi:hypothetical protein